MLRRHLVGIAVPLLLAGAALVSAGDRSELEQQLASFYEPSAEYAGKFGSFHSPLIDANGRKIRTPEEWKTRRAELLAEWHVRFGGPWPELIARPNVARLETVKRDGYAEHRVAVQVFPEEDAPPLEAYLLIPEGDGPFPAALVTFYEPQTSLGRGEKGQGTHDYGVQLARRGIASLSIGTLGSQDLQAGKDTRAVLIEAGIRRKRQPLSILAYVAANCHTALSQQPEIRPDRIGVIGLSYGGKWSMFASCLHEKFACAVWSDPGIVFNEQNANVNYWEPWYLGYDPDVQRKPGVPSDANPRTGLYKRMVDEHIDLVRFHALMSPRPVLVSGGTEDPPANWQALNHLVAINELLGHERRVALTSRATHIPTPAALALEIAFLEYWLKHGLE